MVVPVSPAMTTAYGKNKCALHLGAESLVRLEANRHLQPHQSETPRRLGEEAPAAGREGTGNSFMRHAS